ncbi:MAG: alpha/beta fold hydrolase [Acidobacteriota bacterium]
MLDKISRIVVVSMILTTVTLGDVVATAQQNTNQASTNSTVSSCIDGNWEGTLTIGQNKLRLAIRVTKAPDGALIAKFDSIDQGATDLPVDTLTCKDGTVRFELSNFNITYEGTLNKEKTEITGQFKQGPIALPLSFKRIEKATTINRPQHPQKPYPYHEEEVVYENKKDGIKLTATLTLPRSQGPFPAVVLITGSGPQDRDESLLGHKPFLVIADYLTREGIAVLRADDRGVGGSTGNIDQSTSENFADDALAAVEYLKTRKEINTKQIGLVGHSEGGLIAPIVAAKSTDIAFIVMMAGPGLRGDEILYLQGALISKANGAPETAITRNRSTQDRVFTVLRQEKDLTIAEKQLREILNQDLAAMPEEQRRTTNTNEVIDAMVKRYNTPWFRFFINYDPRPTLKKVKCPVLAINGELDLQVPINENLTAIEAALQAGGNKNYQIVKLPKLNHLFQTSETGSPMEYGKIEETFSPTALKTIGEWIKKQTGQSH